MSLELPSGTKIPIKKGYVIAVNNQLDFLPLDGILSRDKNKTAMAVIHSSTTTRTTHITDQSTINFRTSSKKKTR